MTHRISKNVPGPSVFLHSPPNPGGREYFPAPPPICLEGSLGKGPAIGGIWVLPLSPTTTLPVDVASNLSSGGRVGLELRSPRQDIYCTTFFYETGIDVRPSIRGQSEGPSVSTGRFPEYVPCGSGRMFTSYRTGMSVPNTRVQHLRHPIEHYFLSHRSAAVSENVRPISNVVLLPASRFQCSLASS